MQKHIQAALDDAQSALTMLARNDALLHTIEQAAVALVKALQRSNKVLSCGNGGSMCDAAHFAEELSGRFRANRPALPALAVSDPAHITCVANDFGYEFVFSRFVEGFGRQGDVLLAISTSGTSQNVINAAKAARNREMTVISLTGKQNSPLGNLADYDICTHLNFYTDRVQELHIKVIHILVELVERALFPENYRDD